VEIGKYDEALVYLLEVKEALNAFPRVNYYLAKIYLKKNNLEEAMKYADEEIKYNGTLEWGYFVKGEVHSAKQEFNEAIQNYDKSISINVDYTEGLMSLAKLKQRQNYNEEARELYVRVLKEEPNNAEAHKELGFIYKATGQSILAIESLKVYLDLNPGASDFNAVQNEIKQME
jgi:tetratricopeptide (TPR) repeat protein